MRATLDYPLLVFMRCVDESEAPPMEVLTYSALAEWIHECGPREVTLHCASSENEAELMQLLLDAGTGALH